MSNYTVSLTGSAPWGFRLQGGKDFNMPLTISRLTDGGKAAKAGISTGDMVLSIDGVSTEGMTHLEAQNKIKACTGSVKMNLQRVPTVNTFVSVPAQKEEPKEVVKPVPVISTAPVVPKVAHSAASMAYNKTARPFGAVGAPQITSIPSPSSAFTPTAVTSSRASPTPPSSSVSAAVSHPLPVQPIAPSPPFNTRPSSDGYASASGVAKHTVNPSINVPRQPATYGTSANLYMSSNVMEAAEAQRKELKENQGDSKQQNGSVRRHILDTNVDFPHTPLYSGASKQRLMVDTEDWHPRTGTTQSRSFRILAQITGTENTLSAPSPALETQNEKKANDFVVPTPSGGHAAVSVKTMSKAPANVSKPASSNAVTVSTFQTGGAPGTGRITGPLSASQSAPGMPKATAMTGHVTPSGWSSNTPAKLGVSGTSNRPALQPQPMDQDTLVQRAEHIPAGKRTPMCAQCNSVIRGPFLMALGKSWHPEEFNCAYCKNSMADLGFVQEKGFIYCEHCYEQFFAPECARCQRKILGEIINALKQTWHVGCFICVACHRPIRNNVFHMEDGEPYCETDFYSLFGTMCHGCQFPIEAGDKFLEALGYTWHDTCFVCSVCCTSLEGQAFFSKKDKPLCKKHAHGGNI